MRSCKIFYFKLKYVELQVNFLLLPGYIIIVVIHYQQYSIFKGELDKLDCFKEVSQQLLIFYIIKLLMEIPHMNLIQIIFSIVGLIMQ
jgi:hypothetical protein